MAPAYRKERFPGGSDSKESAYNAGDLGSTPGSGRSPGEGNGYNPWSHKESDMIEQLTHTQRRQNYLILEIFPRLLSFFFDTLIYLLSSNKKLAKEKGVINFNARNT